MNFLIKYLTEEELEEIKNSIDNIDYKDIIFQAKKIENNLDYLTNIGVTNIKDILKYKLHILLLNLDDLKKIFENKENIELINEDILNFDLLGI